MRVMLVDDEQPSLDELVFLLEQHSDVEITGAYLSPLEALAAAGQALPDVAFLDLVLPRMGGVELAEKLHAQNPVTQLVFVTAYAGQLAEAKGIPATGYLLKPVSEAKLSKVLEMLRTGPGL